jgi:hypothetical protein
MQKKQSINIDKYPLLFHNFWQKLPQCQHIWHKIYDEITRHKTFKHYTIWKLLKSKTIILKLLSARNADTPIYNQPWYVSLSQDRDMSLVRLTWNFLSWAATKHAFLLNWHRGFIRSGTPKLLSAMTTPALFPMLSNLHFLGLWIRIHISWSFPSDLIIGWLPTTIATTKYNMGYTACFPAQAIRFIELGLITETLHNP